MTQLMEQASKLNYPPFNMKKTGENTYVIELGVAGFSKNDLELELDGDILSIKGNVETKEDNFIYKGLASRSFTRNFKLADSIKIGNAQLVNGVLRVMLETVIPEKNKIEIEEKNDET